MSVLTDAQRDYMDAVLRGLPAPSGDDSGDYAPQPSSLKPVDAVFSSPASSAFKASQYNMLLVDDDDSDDKPRKPRRKRNNQHKKPGAPGWGNPMDSMHVSGVLDSGDPNYSSAEDHIVEYRASNPQSQDAIVAFKTSVAAIADEYFNSADVTEAAASLAELGTPLYTHYAVKKLITMAMDRKTRECEMAARLLSVVYPNTISADEMSKGFIQLLKCADDLALDVPEAGQLLGGFLARAVVDDVLPPALVKHALTLLSPDDDIVAITALNYCGVQLGARHAAERVLQLWGDDVGLTVDAAKHKVELLITEYLDAGDVPEATRCLRALKMPFFHHELVKKSLVHAIEKPSDHPALMTLLASLGSSREVSQTQMSMGFTRMAQQVEDLALDVPSAVDRFAALLAEAKQKAMLDDAFDPVARYTSEAL